jgi:adenylate kinase family enzyme
MARIVILGCAGSGKTALAEQLGQCTGAPVICLDAIWQPHWVETDVPVFRTLMQEAHAGNDWISDGNFAVATFDIRLPRATLVIWLERSKLFCAWHALTRILHRGEAHRIAGLPKVLAFIWQFDRVNRPRIEATRLCYGAGVPVRRLRNRRDITVFLSSLGNGVKG